MYNLGMLASHMEKLVVLRLFEGPVYVNTSDVERKKENSPAIVGVLTHDLSI